MRKITIITLAVLLSESSVFAENPQDIFNEFSSENEHTLVVDQSAPDRLAQLADFKNHMESFLETVLRNGLEGRISDIYNSAIGTIKATENLVKKKPRGFQARAAFDICSVLTQTALIQLQTEINLHKADDLSRLRDSLLFELHNLHETINGLERSHASLLKEELEYTQRQLDEERETAQKLMQEAETRFSELQSELINVSQDARGTIISMSDILFDIGKATLKGDLKTSLARIAGILIIYRDANVIIEGHTDNVGGEAYNQKLSEERASNVMKFLIDQGVEAGRLTAVGHGFHRPVADNDTREGRQKNRRVDLVIQDPRL